MIIGINGRIGSGKDTIGSIIQFLVCKKQVDYKGNLINPTLTFKQFLEPHRIFKKGWEVKKFADKLKDIVCLLTGCTREQLEDQEFKNRELGEEWRRWRLKVPDLNAIGESTKMAIPLLFNSEEEAWEYNDKELGYRQRICIVYSELPTYRLLLQWIGTDLFRNQLHENVWVNSLISEYKKMN